MLIGFLGVAFSGKSTVAVYMFGYFKSHGINSELILEKAREYIAEYRDKNNLTCHSKVVLTDNDQVAISGKQFKVEKIFKKSCLPNTVIVSDSSIFNSLLYMSDDFVNSPIVKDFFFSEEKLKHYDLLFYCDPVDIEYLPNDSNRIHDKEQILHLQDKCRKLVETLKSKGVHIEHLMLNQDTRVKDACSLSLNKRCKLLEQIPAREFELMV